MTAFDRGANFQIRDSVCRNYDATSWAMLIAAWIG